MMIFKSLKSKDQYEERSSFDQYGGEQRQKAVGKVIDYGLIN